MSTMEERFWSKVDLSDPDGCWPWTGSKIEGYGSFYFEKHNRRAHRVSWLLAGRELPEPPLVFDHLCRNRACVNPDHLEIVTNRENVLRGETLPAKMAQATHCCRGHAFDDRNTYRTPEGKRECRACHNERSRIRRKRLRERRVQP